MTQWHFRRREEGRGIERGVQIDASNLRRSALDGKDADEVATLKLVADGDPIRLDEVFELTTQNTESDEIIVEGDLVDVHGLAARHDSGLFTIKGDAGSHVGCGMTGGNVMVEGRCGDYAGAPDGAHKTGMSGGLLHIGGDAGDYVGHRMRRGTVAIGGSAGSYVAASMVAGTIIIAGELGDDLAVGMRRGSIVLAGDGYDAACFGRGVSNSGRFSQPSPFKPDFLVLYQNDALRNLLNVHRVLEGESTNPFLRSRCDRTVGGLGEVIYRAERD